MEGLIDLVWLVICQDGLPVHRQSPI